MSDDRQAPANEAGRRKALERFGYADTPSGGGGGSIDSDREWALLVPSVAPWLGGRRLADLPASHRDLAMQRVLQRRELDELMRDCDLAHARIASGGARTDLVEAYATARDRFEDAVESFAASAESLAARLRSEA